MLYERVLRCVASGQVAMETVAAVAMESAKKPMLSYVKIESLCTQKQPRVSRMR